ncbi:hypothetical protein ACP4OV_001057 [Aristida adscensionis]
MNAVVELAPRQPATGALNAWMPECGGRRLPHGHAVVSGRVRRTGTSLLPAAAARWQQQAHRTGRTGTSLLPPGSLHGRVACAENGVPGRDAPFGNEITVVIFRSARRTRLTRFAGGTLTERDKEKGMTEFTALRLLGARAVARSVFPVIDALFLHKFNLMRSSMEEGSQNATEKKLIGQRERRGDAVSSVWQRGRRTEASSGSCDMA